MIADKIKMSASGYSTPIDCTVFSPNFSIGLIGLIATVSAGGSLTYSVQVTADPNPLDAAANWNEHDVITAKTASINSNIAYPITGIRLHVSVYASGSVNLGVAIWPK